MVVPEWGEFRKFVSLESFLRAVAAIRVPRVALRVHVRAGRLIGVVSLKV